jgi:hypothetical protein
MPDGRLIRRSSVITHFYTALPKVYAKRSGHRHLNSQIMDL